MTDVAIVGMACVFPGAPDLAAFWANICAGVDAIADIPDDRRDAVFHDPASTAFDRFYTRRGGFVDGVARVDPARHGVMPSAARGAEPDGLLALDVAAAALRDAGYGERGFARERAGVILGRGGYAGAGRTRLEQQTRGAEQVIAALRGLLPALAESELLRVRHELQAALGGPAGPEGAIGLVPNLAASRVAHRLDLHGPAYTVDAACASALVAVDQACLELGARRCDLVLAGGVHLCQDEAFWSVFCQLGALSRRGEIRPFDRRADGLLIGEGAGVLVLKRRADAERDGDRVYAVLRGTGVASDGRAGGLVSPGVDGQVRALERAWRDAGLDPASVGLVEAHGTATPAGDAAELETLRRVFGAAADGPRAGLGSVKSMIGHAMPAAGAAGLIKAALAVYHGVLPPTLHCEEPHAALAATRFRPVAAAEPWEAETRRAAVNAFGFGGINAHVVLEKRAPRARPRPRPPRRLLAVAAATPQALLAVLPTEVTAPLTRAGDGPCRLALLDPTPERIARARAVVGIGRPWSGREEIWYTPRGLLADGGKLAFVYPGLDAAFQPRVDDLPARFGVALPPGLDAASLEETGLGVFGVSRLLERLLGELGVHPDVVCGHSIGEWTAMIAAGMIPDETVEAFAGAVHAGCVPVPGVVFAAAGCGRGRAAEAMAGLPDLALSHDNCPHQVILCGVEPSVDAALARLRAAGVLGQKLPFRSGFHTPLFADHLGPHVARFAALPLRPARVPLYSATLAAPYPAELDDVRALAVEHLISPVRFRELAERLHDDGARLFVQCGTGSLVGFIEDTLRGRPHLAIAANDPKRGGVEQLARVAAALWVEGAAPALEALFPAPAPALPLGVPLYRPAAPLAAAPAAAPIPTTPLGGAFSATLDAIAGAQAEVLAALAPRERTTTRRLSLDTHPELVDHTFFRQPEGWPVIADRHPVVPMTALIAWMIDAARPLAPGRVAVAVEDARAFRWLVVASPIDARLAARLVAPDRVAVSIDGYAEATVVFAAAYPPAPPPDARTLANERPAPIAAAALYRDRWMFHGPAYQGIVELGAVGDDGVRGALIAGRAIGALLDNAGQLFGWWVMIENELDRLAMPVHLARVELFGPDPAPGTRLGCTVRLARKDPKSVVADLELTASGRTWCRIAGWEDRRFDTDERLWNVFRFPERHLLAEPRAGGVVFVDRYRAAPTREQLERRFLGARERAAYEALPPLAQRAWLGARIAAKDAVRDHLWRRGSGPLFPVEIELDGDGPFAARHPHGTTRVRVVHDGDLVIAEVLP